MAFGELRKAYGSTTSKFDVEVEARMEQQMNKIWPHSQDTYAFQSGEAQDEGIGPAKSAHAGRKLRKAETIITFYEPLQIRSPAVLSSHPTCQSISPCIHALSMLD